MASQASAPAPHSQRSSSWHEISATDDSSESQAEQQTDATAPSPPSPSPSTALENNDRTSTSPPSSSSQTQAMTPPTPSLPSPPPDPRKCWICYEDETESTPTTSPWRSPCPCALQAHEQCLLDWVADLESPRTTSSTVGQQKRIECPQCKTSIEIRRPNSYALRAARAIERVVYRLVWPGIGTILVCGVYSTCWFHGALSTFLIFGIDDSRRLIAQNMDSGADWRWMLAFPLVPFALVGGRTDLLDRFLPVLPVSIFLLSSAEVPARVQDVWPPSAAMTLALLPYVRGLYNALYRRLLAPRERAWMKELQPRQGEGSDGDGGEAAAEAERRREDDDDDDLAEEMRLVDIEFAMAWEEEEEAEEEARPPPQEHVPAPAPAPDALAPDANNHMHEHAERAIFTTAQIADTVLGALAFPAIAAAMGGLLRTALPRAWTTTTPGASASPPPGLIDMLLRRSVSPPLGGKRPGLLQTHWGRSIVGGCLFVVLKDSFVLYTRFRLAQVQRQRRVVDWGERGGVRARG